MSIDHRMALWIRSREHWLEARSHELAFDEHVHAQAVSIHIEPAVLSYRDLSERSGDLLGRAGIHDGRRLVLPALNEQVFAVHDDYGGTYYDRGYSRGDWPALREMIVRLLRYCPHGEVWYGASGDPEYPLRAMTDERMRDLDALWNGGGDSHPTSRHADNAPILSDAPTR